MTQAHRVAQIQALPEAASRPALARTIAMQTNCSVSAAQRILRSAAEEQSSSGQPSGGPQESQSTDDAAEDSVRQMIRAMGLKGFKQADD